MRIVRLLAAAVFVICVPLAISLTNLRLMALDAATYEWGFQTFGASAKTGMSQAELRTAAAQLIAYIDRGEPITLQVDKDGQVAPLFNSREMAHMADVRALFQLGFLAQETSLAYLAAFTVVSFVIYGLTGLRATGRYLLIGGLLTVVLLLSLFIAAQSNFDSLWTQFHLLSFSNDLWQLDPRTDYMIRLFPEAFWLQVVVTGALRSLVAALSAIVLGTAIVLLMARYSHLEYVRRRW